MLGAILGEYVANIYDHGLAGELERFKEKEDVVLPEVALTECIRLNAAVIEALKTVDENADDKAIDKAVIQSILGWMLFYKDFWPEGEGPTNPDDKKYLLLPALCVSSIGLLYSSLERVMHVAKVTANATVADPDAIEAAQIVAAAFFLTDQEFNPTFTVEDLEEEEDESLPEIGTPEYEEACKQYIWEFCMEQMGFPASYDPEADENQGPLQVVACALRSFREEDSWDAIVKKAYIAGGNICASIAGAIAKAGYSINAELVTEFRLHLPQRVLSLMDYALYEGEIIKGIQPIDDAIYKICRAKQPDEKAYFLSQMPKLLASCSVYLPLHPNPRNKEAVRRIYREEGIPTLVDGNYVSEYVLDLELIFMIEHEKELAVFTCLNQTSDLPNDVCLYQLSFTELLDSFRKDRTINGIYIIGLDGTFTLKQKDFNHVMELAKGIRRFQDKEFPY